jgi:hypothetical protein
LNWCLIYVTFHYKITDSLCGKESVLGKLLRAFPVFRRTQMPIAHCLWVWQCVGSTEIVIPLYQTTQHHIPEDSSLHSTVRTSGHMFVCLFCSQVKSGSTKARVAFFEELWTCSRYAPMLEYERWQSEGYHFRSLLWELHWLLKILMFTCLYTR